MAKMTKKQKRSYEMLEAVQNEDSEVFAKLLGSTPITEEMAITAIEQSSGEMLEMMEPHTSVEFWTTPGIWIAVLAADEVYIDLIHGFAKGGHPLTIEGVPFLDYVKELDLSDEILELLL